MATEDKSTQCCPKKRKVDLVKICRCCFEKYKDAYEECERRKAAEARRPRDVNQELRALGTAVILIIVVSIGIFSVFFALLRIFNL